MSKCYITRESQTDRKTDCETERQGDRKTESLKNRRAEIGRDKQETDRDRQNLKYCYYYRTAFVTDLRLQKDFIFQMKPKL
jgi:hypothetical protein